MASSSPSETNVYENEHEAFSASRCDDYVYVPSTPKCFKHLDKHVDSVEHDIKLPLVVLGEPGIGKSAMLANWMQRRQVNMHRDDFMFKHFVGSSPVSCQLSNMLYRLETALKDHYHLREMEVPEAEDRLRWGLTRYLAAAAKKAYPSHIVIVIDGINALKSENSPDGALHWLPTELPGNVRVIVSTVVYGISPEEEAELHEANSASSASSSSVIGGVGSVAVLNAAGGQQGQREPVDRNRTYTELRRRQCRISNMEPLGVNVRHRIIDDFVKKYGSILALDEKQHFRIVTARATSQPLFLRMLLYALKLGVDLSDKAMSIDEQLDLYLNKHDTAMGLISEILDFCQKYVERKRDGSQVTGLLGRVLAAVYVSRNGLSDEEIWGSVELAMGQKLLPEYLDATFRLLKDVTIVVNGLRTFSHESFRRVVYLKYIQTPEAHIQQHELMARYFNRFPSCDRKLDSLAYHLEVSGSWTKLKNALIEVENFRIWWTAKHKKEFIALWASLTNRKDPTTYAKRLVTGEFDEATMRYTQTQRPYFDIVEEFTRSVEDHRETQHPKDEQIGEVILHIADFLLEFAMLGHEETADVPCFVHPMVPNEDMSSLGVPYLSIDEGGNTTLVQPLLTGNGAEDGGAAGKSASLDLPPKANEETPTISTYFYYRWMWIQFPYVALANCGDRFHDGVALLQKNTAEKLGRSSCGVTTATGEGQQEAHGGHGGGSKGGKETKSFPTASAAAARRAADADRVSLPTAKIPHSLVKIATQPLPHIPIRKPTRIRQPVIPGGQMNEGDEVAGAMDKMASELYKDIKQYRYEHDILIQQKLIYDAKLLDLKNEMTDLTRTYSGSVAILEKYRDVREKEKKTHNICDKLRVLNKNLTGVLLMCERHPAVHPSLIHELEVKIEQDEQMIAQIKDRIWEETFENQGYEIDYPKLRAAIQETLMLQHEMLMARYRLRENLASAANANLSMLNRGIERSIGGAGGGRTSIANIDRRHSRGASGLNKHRKGSKSSSAGSIGLGGDSRKSSSFSDNKMARWLHIMSAIYAKTGISEIGLFFQKFSNCDVLEEQMSEMKKSAERKLAELKAEQQRVEKDLYDLHNSMGDSSSAVGGVVVRIPGLRSDAVTGADEADSMEQQMRRAYVEFKRAREKATAASNLEQKARAGLKHVAEILGIQQTDPAAQVHELVHQIEGVLDILQDEAERHQQQKLTGGGGGGDHTNKAGGTAAGEGNNKHNMSENLTSRPPELEEALKSFESPKARVPYRLVNRPMKDDEQSSHAEVNNMVVEEDDKEAVKSRKEVKLQAMKNLRAQQRKVMKLSSIIPA